MRRVVDHICVPLHDHSCKSSNQNSSGNMVPTSSEILCGFSGISTVVMSGSHAYTIHLNSDIPKEDHVTLS